VWLDPECPLPTPGVLSALSDADVIVLGPGSLFTSIIPNVLVADVADAIHTSPALKVYICNLMTQAGETEEFAAKDHLQTIQSYLPPNSIDVCVLNTRSASPMQIRRYMEKGGMLVSPTPNEIESMGIQVETCELLEEHDGKVRHDRLALARLIVSLAHRQREREVLCAES
jgi:uncharacterized cofD-like protein